MKIEITPTPDNLTLDEIMANDFTPMKQPENILNPSAGQMVLFARIAKMPMRNASGKSNRIPKKKILGLVLPVRRVQKEFTVTVGTIFEDISYTFRSGSGSSHGI